MYNDLITIGSVTIHTYGVMIAIGILAAYFTLEYRVKKCGLNQDKVFWLVIWCLAFGFAGAKILYFFTILPQIASDPSIILRSLADGWVVYGGIIGGILGAYLFCRRHRLQTLRFFDLGLASVALGQGFGRLGCFFAGCCYGVETDSWFSIVFEHSHFAPNGVHLVPTQLISSALDFLLALFLILLYRRKNHKPGQCAAMYLICYGVGRFILEFFRGDLIRGKVGIISTSQFISIFIVIAGLVLFVLVTRAKRKAPKTVIFDLDGTLLYTLDSIAHPTNEALKAYDLPEQPVENFKRYVGDGYVNAVKRALTDAGDPEFKKFEEVYAIGRKLYDEDPLYQVKPYPGMEDAIRKLKEGGLKLAVLTNKPHASAVEVVEHFFGKGTFDMICGQQENKPIKPDIRCTEPILKTMKVWPKECAYIGDSNTDMKMGKTADFYTVGVLWGYRSEEELRENHADVILTNPDEIPEECLWENIQKSV